MKIVQGYLRVIAMMLLLVFPAQAAEVVTYYHTDPVGTPLAITDSAGQKAWEADYKPFGEEYTVAATQENNRRFVGKEKDAETGLDYFGARYMATDAGRFLAVDPVRAVDGFSGGINGALLGNPQRLNTYAYSLNNPYRYVDPDGLAPGDVYLFWGGDLAPYIAKFSKGLYGHAAIEISGGQFLSAGKSDTGALQVYVRGAESELKGRSFDVFRPNYQVNTQALDGLAGKLKGANYLKGNVCSQTTSRGITASNNDPNAFDWGGYLIQVSPNDIGSDVSFNKSFDWLKTVKHKDGYNKIIKPSGSYLSSGFD